MKFTGFVVLAVLSAASSLPAAVIDLTTLGAEGTVNGAIFRQGSQGAGTGVLNSFVRLQNQGNTDISRGYNTDGVREFDTLGGAFTRSVLVSSLQPVTIDSTTYFQFVLDINEPQGGGQASLSLYELEVYTGTAGNLTGYPTFGGNATLVYDLDAGEDSRVELLSTLSTGSGTSDAYFYLPTSVVTATGQPYLYLYSAFGIPNAAEGGFEEWAALEGSTSEVPEPSTWLLVGIGTLLSACRLRRRS